MKNLSAQQMADKIKHFEAESSMNQSRANEYKQPLAEKQCPFFIGQELNHSHEGRGKVERIYYQKFEPYFGLTVRRYKKDGTPRVYSGEYSGKWMKWEPLPESADDIVFSGEA